MKIFGRREGGNSKGGYSKGGLFEGGDLFENWLHHFKGRRVLLNRRTAEAGGDGAWPFPKFSKNKQRFSASPGLAHLPSITEISSTAISPW